MENPFIVTGKIKPEFFCDRVEEVHRVTRSLLSGGENLVIISPRRLGKTGLINFCFEKPEVNWCSCSADRCSRLWAAAVKT